MKKQLLAAGLVMSMATTSYAQWSSGALVGLGHSWHQQVSQSPDYVGQLYVEPVSLKMAGGYGQFATKGKWGMLAGLQLRYQYQQQARGNYDYLVLTPYIGTRLFGKVEVAAGPELTTLLRAGIAFNGLRSSPARLIIGYNVKATYWLGRFGIEGGYSHQSTAFNREESPATPTITPAIFDFYNRYVYGALKYRLTQ